MSQTFPFGLPSADASALAQFRNDFSQASLSELLQARNESN